MMNCLPQILYPEFFERNLRSQPAWNAGTMRMGSATCPLNLEPRAKGFMQPIQVKGFSCIGLCNLSAYTPATADQTFCEPYPTRCGSGSPLQIISYSSQEIPEAQNSSWSGTRPFWDVTPSRLTLLGISRETREYGIQGSSRDSIGLSGLDVDMSGALLLKIHKRTIR